MRFDKYGGEEFNDYELLELLLMFSTPRRDVNPLAKELLRIFGSVRGVIFAAPGLLSKVPGIGKNTELLLRLVGDIGVRCLYENLQEMPLLNNMSSLECYLRMKIGMDHNEKLMILFLDRKGYLQSEWCESGLDIGLQDYLIITADDCISIMNDLY